MREEKKLRHIWNLTLYHKINSVAGSQNGFMKLVRMQENYLISEKRDKKVYCMTMQYAFFVCKIKETIYKVISNIGGYSNGKRKGTFSGQG